MVAIGLSGQMHGVVLADDRGRPLRPAILWADTRSTRELAAYRGLCEEAGSGSPTRRRHGRAYSPLAARPRARYIRLSPLGAPAQGLAAAATYREAAAEPSDASATLLYDLLSDDWDYAVVEALGLHAGLLAPLVPSAGVAGTLTREAARSLGLRTGLPVAAGAADTAAAMLGGGSCGQGWYS